ncbi:hypothetical protein BPNPMPFG_006342 [Mesorhizobium sp. AR07]|nr:hypothetical protein BPNPMPFG_006342 [Mesorhizobium sp. AR07]
MAMTADPPPDDPGALKAMVPARDVENAILSRSSRNCSATASAEAETLPEDQLLLGLEEAEQIEAADKEENEQAAPTERLAKTAKRRPNCGTRFLRRRGFRQTVHGTELR